MELLVSLIMLLRTGLHTRKDWGINLLQMMLITKRNRGQFFSVCVE